MECNTAQQRMPSPVGHALGGLAAAFLVDLYRRRRATDRRAAGRGGRAGRGTRPRSARRLASHLHTQHWRCRRRWRRVVAGRCAAESATRAGGRSAHRRVRVASAARLAEQGHVVAVRTDGRSGRSRPRTTFPGGISSAKSRDGTGCRRNSSSATRSGGAGSCR